MIDQHKLTLQWYGDDGWFLADEDFEECWWSILACSLVAVQFDSWCAHPTALWSDEGLSWGWLGCCSLFLPPAFFLCGFMPLYLEHTTGFPHWWVTAVSVWGLLLPCPMADSRLGKLSLQLVVVTLSWSTLSRFPSLSSLKNTAPGMHTSSILLKWPAQRSCTWRKMDCTLGRLSLFRTSSFDTWSCHLTTRMECKQQRWNRSSSLICFR